CSEPWFCIPHLASDDYVRRSAQLIHARLRPGLRVWVEHSNETWNGAFPQASYVQQRGLALGLATDAWQAGWFWHSRRSVQIFQIFSEVFGSARPLQRVMGGFVTVPWGNEQALSFEDADLATDVLAIAPYFGHEWGSERVGEARQMTSTQLVQALRTQSLPPVLALIGENRALAKSHGVGLVAYEGGHHLAAPQLPWNDPVHAVFHSAARSSAMGTLYADYLDAWDAAGGGAFVNFSLCGGFTQWGCWSVLEWITQPSTPRESALIAHAAGQWLPSCSVCTGDVNGDGIVGAPDLSEVLFRWGPATGSIAADLNQDGVVNAADVSLVLANWGACDG
ncbi:MAG: dockerin type I domain-containing protein, partial [bacterium]